MKKTNQILITIKPYNDIFKAFIHLEDLLTYKGNLEKTLENAGLIYTNRIKEMKKLILIIKDKQKNKIKGTAQLYWMLGNEILE